MGIKTIFVFFYLVSCQQVKEYPFEEKRKTFFECLFAAQDIYASGR